MHIHGNTIISHLGNYAALSPLLPAFILPGDGAVPEQRVSFEALYKTVLSLGTGLEQRIITGSRVLLVYGNVLHFIKAFLACQYAGLVAVPVFYTRSSRQLSRLSAIISNAGVSTVLCTADVVAPLRQALGAQLNNIPLLCTDDDLLYTAAYKSLPEPAATDTAFIQYTSGSTGMPKGVVVSHSNLLHNEQLLQQTFGCTRQSVILSWLPFHHDMGLIGNLLHGVYTGCTVVLLSPFRFMQQPLTWLQYIHQYRVTHSGGPNFAYDLCVDKITSASLAGLDLSCWKLAYNGAEPVRPETMRRFAEFLQHNGFTCQAFSPCYGLAEATLLVSGIKLNESPVTIHVHKQSINTGRVQAVEADHPQALAIAGSGSVAEGMYVHIIDPATGRVCENFEEGEICIAGQSVTSGYWQQPVPGLFYEMPDGRFLRTGDMGFMNNGHLFVHGRIKEMIIIRGENHYPYDMEQAAAASHEALEKNGVAVFAISEGEGLVCVAAELKRSYVQQQNYEAVIRSVEQALAAGFGIIPHDIVLTTPLALPRTTSGKLQRTLCAKLYAGKELKGLTSLLAAGKRANAILPDPQLLQAVLRSGNYAEIKAWLLNLIAVATGQAHDLMHDDETLTAAGLDSLRMMELVNTVNRELQINIMAEDVLEQPTVAGLTETIEAMLWLQNQAVTGNEVTV